MVRIDQQLGDEVIQVYLNFFTLMIYFFLSSECCKIVSTSPADNSSTPIREPIPVVVKIDSDEEFEDDSLGDAQLLEVALAMDGCGSQPKKAREDCL